MPSYFGLFDEIMSHSDKEQPVIGKNFSYELPKNYQGIYDAKVHSDCQSDYWVSTLGVNISSIFGQNWTHFNEIVVFCE